MVKNKSNTELKEDVLIYKILTLRNHQVMLDKDLAALYGVKPTRMREQAKRNKIRFPDNFMFQLTEKEGDEMVSQNAIPT